ncbi:MAG TPA: hypothetical protein VFS43_19015 [Polyangiaceae bacterium]|nr:hypothetical protein [Polyangiaceae bacterium]
MTALALLAPLGAFSLGCATTGAAGAASAKQPAIADEKFASAVVSLLREREPGSAARRELLAGVVQRQLVHAGERLSARQRERGVASAFGALYLVRNGELRPEMLRGPGERALELSAEAVAATGDEGKALALYNLRRAALGPGDRSLGDLQGHAAALRQWSDAFVSKPGVGPHEVAGYRARVAVGRALLEPTEPALREARAAVNVWGEGGMMFQTPGQLAMRGERSVRPTRREDALEGYRAYASAGLTLASIYLRHGDARGAFEAIASSRVEAITPPALVERLRAAAEGDNAAAWRALVEVYSSALQNSDDVGVDRDLLRAAAFGTATEAYRRDRRSPEVALSLASSLVAMGMPEAAPGVLVDALRSNPDPELASTVFETLGRVMWREVESDDPQSAHRIFRASEPLLALGDAGPLRGRVRPSSNTLRLLAARVEARAGQLPAARALLTSLVRQEPSGSALLLAAEVERQLREPRGALGYLDAALASPELRSDPVREAEARLLAADLHRELGDPARARQDLSAALAAVLRGRHPSGPRPQLARAERVLARVLDRFGDEAGAARASARALEAGQSDPDEVSAALLEALARAYVSRDLEAARRLARKSLSAGLGEEAMVYVGIWLQALERETRAKTDGTAAEALAQVKPGPSWPGRLLAWAQGKLTDADLAKAARTPGQRLEAQFYGALSRRAAGDAAGSESALRAVAQAPSLDLMEAQIARDLVAGPGRRVQGPPPVKPP